MVDYALGTLEGRLVFLESDGWICSTSLGDVDTESGIPHFNIPADGLSVSCQLNINITASSDGVFVNRSELEDHHPVTGPGAVITPRDTVEILDLQPFRKFKTQSWKDRVERARGLDTYLGR